MPALLDGLQLLAKIRDSLLRQPAVDFQLLFTRAAQADTALGLPRKVRPHPLQARHLIFQLSQLHGQAGFMRPGAAGENIKDQLRTIEHFHARRLSRVARLAGTEMRCRR